LPLAPKTPLLWLKVATINPRHPGLPVAGGAAASTEDDERANAPAANIAEIMILTQRMPGLLSARRGVERDHEADKPVAVAVRGHRESRLAPTYAGLGGESSSREDHPQPVSV
jgi:hypothetical protein